MDWIAVYTHARAEAKAAQHLRQQGFTTYLPRYLKRRSHARRIDWVPSPLFPRYVFVSYDAAATQWRPILSTFGVCSLVRFGEQPMPVTSTIIDDILSREDERGFVVMGRNEGFRKGDRVRILVGPLADTEALFECADDNDRATLLLTLLGRQVRAQVPIDAVADARLG